jgi:putative membrane protein
MMWGHGIWGMGPWGGYGGFGGFGMIFGIIILVVIIAALVWFARGMSSSGQQLPLAGRRSSGLEVLEERYARGEIQRDEYLEKKRDIGG